MGPAAARVGRLLVGKAWTTARAGGAGGRRPRRSANTPARFDVTFAATVQEEIGILGAASLGRARARYDMGFIVDNGLAGDIPTVSERTCPCGWAAGRRSCTATPPRTTPRAAHARAARGRGPHGIPVQDVVLYHYYSDGANLIRQGIETVLVAPPIRYSHSPFEAVDPADLDATAGSLVAYLNAAETGSGR